ncbi:MAG: hypothetical protein CL681_05475 [Blastopirellula sp.]|nr:hypothetical protein [Blastopirellula sp.]
MANIMKSIDTLNSTVRTLLAIVVAGALGVGGWFGYETVNENRLAKERLETAQAELANVQGQLRTANATIEEQSLEIARLHLLKVDHRVARLRVLDQFEDPESGETLTQVSFVELDDRNQELGKPQKYTVTGEQVYVDGWVVKFDDKYVEEADLYRATALFIFRRLYGDGQEPRGGELLDVEGSAPKIYTRGNEMSDFEKRIWNDFWSVANDKAKQEELGIHAAHGLSAHVKAKKGMAYRVELGATGDVSLIPEDAPPEPQLDPS